MSSYAKIILIGHVGKAPEARFLPNGDQVTSFSLATSEKRNGQEQTTWWSISAFGKLGETCQQYITKGMQVYCEGRLTPREYTDRDGKSRTSLDVRASEIRMLDRRSDEESTPPRQSQSAADDPNFSEIPF